MQIHLPPFDEDVSEAPGVVPAARVYDPATLGMCMSILESQGIRSWSFGDNTLSSYGGWYRQAMVSVREEDLPGALAILQDFANNYSSLIIVANTDDPPVDAAVCASPGEGEWCMRILEREGVHANRIVTQDDAGETHVTVVTARSVTGRAQEILRRAMENPDAHEDLWEEVAEGEGGADEIEETDGEDTGDVEEVPACPMCGSREVELHPDLKNEPWKLVVRLAVFFAIFLFAGPVLAWLGAGQALRMFFAGALILWVFVSFRPRDKWRCQKCGWHGRTP